ncbi:CAP domain-containing protein [Treponema maltophilum]|uniref:CAP domain-containing protein n=1 Tax=Treponema maltophilum TaxID=51160 RepID=UPI003D909D52
MKKRFVVSLPLVFLSLLFMSCPLDGNGQGSALAVKQEREVVEEINFARTQPKEYVKARLQPYVDAGTASKAMKECINEMNGKAPLKPLQVAAGLTLAAREWVALQGPSGYIGHDMNLSDRLRKYCYFWGFPGENISYGYNDAKTIVIALLEDDGVPSRGHRNNILNAGFAYIGVGFGPHKKYGYMCVQDFTGGYKDK